MGKQVCKSSIKISKNDNHHRHHHQHCNHELLKPKVYITHSSTFKTLVQELTRNDDTAKPSIASPTQQAGNHGLQIKHKDRHTHDTQICNNQEYVPSFDDLDSSLLTPFEASETSNQIGMLQDTNTASLLQEVDPFVLMFD